MWFIISHTLPRPTSMNRAISFAVCWQYTGGSVLFLTDRFVYVRIQADCPSPSQRAVERHRDLCSGPIRSRRSCSLMVTSMWRSEYDALCVVPHRYADDKQLLASAKPEDMSAIKHPLRKYVSDVMEHSLRRLQLNASNTEAIRTNRVKCVNVGKLASRDHKHRHDDT